MKVEDLKGFWKGIYKGNSKYRRDLGEWEWGRDVILCNIIKKTKGGYPLIFWLEYYMSYYN